MEKENCILISSGKNWMEQAAKDQLLAVSRLPGVVKAVGLPDLHPGRIPVGTAVLSRGVLYPHLLGNDIGCGMSLFDTGVKKKKFKQEKWVSRLEAVRELEDIPFSNPYEEECPIRDLGTLGGGNHFAEFQCVERIYDQEAAGSLGLCADRILLLVHCGSRGYGQEILSRFWVPEGLADGSEQAEAYMAEHDRALRWAVRNRRAAAQKLLAWLGGASEPELLMDSCHNYLERTKDGLLHRKGSVSASKGAVVIPGSRGSLTYVCIPREDTAVSLNSLSHGAGRKWARSICKSRIDQKYDRDSIRCTGLKSRVVCHDTNLLFAEAPEAYKNVEQVMGVLQEYGLIDIAATLRPLITFKDRRESMRVQISSGQGPAECELAVAMLYEELRREAGDVRLIGCTPGKKPGCMSSVVFETDRDLRELEGSVQWICKSPYRPGHRRKNWYVDVSILDQVPRISEERMVRFETFRSGGKGGQHVNKVETGVRAIHIPTGTAVVSTQARSQHMNKQIAMDRLCSILAEMNAINQQKEKSLAWMEHARLERGNPVRIYEGMKFERSRKR